MITLWLWSVDCFHHCFNILFIFQCYCFVHGIVFVNKHPFQVVILKLNQTRDNTCIQV